MDRDFFVERLYPVQDKILDQIGSIDTEF